MLDFSETFDYLCTIHGWTDAEILAFMMEASAMDG